MEPIIERRLRSLQAGLWFMGGIALALAVIFISGDFRFVPDGFPYGWAVLWLVSLIGCPPLGIVLLIGPSWRSLPLERRRGIALGYMAVGLLDLLAVSVRLSIEGSGPGLWVVVVGYGLIVLLAGVATQPQRARMGEDLFP